MTLTSDHIFAIIVALLGVCTTIGGYVIRDVLRRIKELEEKKCLDDQTHLAICESAQNKSLVAQGKSAAELHKKINKVIAIQYLMAGGLGIDIKGIDPE